MRVVNRLLGYIDSVNTWTARLISPLIIIITFIIAWEVFVRQAFNKPTIWVHEMSYMIFGGYFMLAGGYLLLKDRHVKVEVLTERLSRKKRIIIDLATYLLFFFYCGVLLYTSWILAWESFLRGDYTSSVWAPPRWPVLMVIPLGAFLMLMQGLAKFVRDVAALFRKGTE